MTPLLTALQSAERGSRELDSAIVEAFDLAPLGSTRMSGVEHGTWATGAYTTWVAPHYTTSIDAALALVERVCPDLRVRLDLDERPRAFLYERGGYTIGAMRGEWKHYADAPTPPLALVIALVRAKESM
jgi:hypothetical protein